MSFLERIAQTIRMDDEFFRTDSTRRSNGMPVHSNGRWTAGERLSVLKWLTVQNVFAWEVTYSRRFEFFLTTLTSFCVCIIAAKLSVKLLCCLRAMPRLCHEQTVMTRVASDIQSSSRRNSSGHWLVLKPLIPRSKWLGQLTLKYAGKCSEIWVKNSEKNFPQLDCTLGYSMARISCLDDAFSEGNSTARITKE